jgi:hypothetical protein
MGLVLAATSAPVLAVRTDGEAESPAAVTWEGPASGQAGGDPYRPTWIGTVNTARVPGAGSFVAGIGASLGARHGLGGNFELGWEAGTFVMGTPLPTATGSTTYFFKPSVQVKYMYADSAGMSLASTFFMQPDIASPSAGNWFDSGSFAVGMPVSFWKAGPGSLHLDPYYDLVTAAATGDLLEPLGLNAAYEVPLGQTWSLILRGATTWGKLKSSLAGWVLYAQSRVRLGQHVTLDIGDVRFVPDPTAFSLANQLTFNLFNLRWYWGGTPADVTRALGM